MFPETTMTPARWQRLTDLVNDCLELPFNERNTFLEKQCTVDPTLLAEAQKLLANAAETTQFLESPISASLPQDALVGQRLGAYRVTSVIAQGGMGAVVKAVRDDDAYEKVVAIKVIRSDVGSRTVVARFKAERQILATLDHPHIARLIDGGTTHDGRPYFVMDYVDGEPIDLYCKSRQLTVAQRLALFRTVCETVHFAHQRLIVHRDLKPSNIFVDRSGNVKLLDFGIAKLLDPERAPKDFELTVAQAMTPAYASPEQIKGETITTASDIYALGVILYRLLVGRSPYTTEPTKPLDLAREIVETDPQRPSTAVNASETKTPDIEPARLKRALQGDLDNIVMMALRKEPSRRYLSAEQLGEDIRRSLHHETVLAHEDTFLYRAKKFVQRNRWSTGMASLGVVALTALTAVALYQAQKATTEKNRAEAHFASVRKLANASIFEIPNAIKNLPGSAAVQKKLIENAVKYLDELAAEKDTDFGILTELGAGYVSLSQLEGSAITQANLGNAKAGRKSLETGIGYLRSAYGQRPDDSTVSFHLATALRKLAEFEWYQQQFDLSAKAVAEAISIGELHQRSTSSEDRNALELASAYVVQARTTPAARASREKREEGVNKAIELLKTLGAPTRTADTQSKALQNLTVAYDTKAEIISNPSDVNATQRAYAINQESIDISERLLALDPQNRSYLYKIGGSYTSSAATASDLKRIQDAIRFRKRASEAYGTLASLEPNDQNAATLYAYTLALFAEALLEADTEAATETVNRASSIQSKIAIEHQGTLYFRATTLIVASVESAVAAERSKVKSLPLARRTELCSVALARYRDARRATEPLKALFLDQPEDPIKALKEKLEACRPIFGARVVL